MVGKYYEIESKIHSIFIKNINEWMKKKYVSSNRNNVGKIFKFRLQIPNEFAPGLIGRSSI